MEKIIKKSNDKIVYLCEDNTSKYIAVDFIGDNLNEILYYTDIEPHLNIAPEIYLIDKEKNRIHMEFMNECGFWDKEYTKNAIDLLIKLHNHLVGSKACLLKDIAKNEFKNFNYSFYSDIDFIKDNIYLVRDSVLELLEEESVLVHGDFSYINSGIGKKGLCIFDWSDMCVAPPAYELSYFEHFFETEYDNFKKYNITKDDIISYYTDAMKIKNINKFKYDWYVFYLYRCLFRYIPSYYYLGMKNEFENKVSNVCNILKTIIERKEVHTF